MRGLSVEGGTYGIRHGRMWGTWVTRLGFGVRWSESGSEDMKV